MTRGVLTLVAVAVLVVAGFFLVRGGGSQPAPPVGPPPPSAEVPGADGPRLVVRVDGEEVADPDIGGTRRLSDLPVSSIRSSMVSHVRSNGSFDVLVLTDGSEVLLDEYTRERLPDEVVLRADYDRGGS